MGVVQAMLEQLRATQGQDTQRRLEKIAQAIEMSAKNEKEAEAEEHPSAFKKPKAKKEESE